MDNIKSFDFYFDSACQGYRIHSRVWIPEISQPKAVIQIAHGMAEHIGRYEEMARFFAGEGYVVAANDHIGHGKSVNKKEEQGDMPSDKVPVRDMRRLMIIMKRHFPGLKYIILGHSMGSFFAREFIIKYGSEADGAVIMGTGNQPKAVVKTGILICSLIGKLKGKNYRSRLVYILSFGSYNSRIKNRKHGNDWFSTDTESNERYRSDPDCGAIFTVRAMKAMFSAILFDESRANIKKIPGDLPILLMAGKEDPVGSYGKGPEKAMKDYLSCGIRNVTLNIYEGCRHELHNEPVKNDVFRDILDWISTQVL